MLCSNCGVLEIRYETRVPGKCENGHNLCGKCVVEGNDKCMICEGRVFEGDENAWIHSQTDGIRNWTPDMIREWSLQPQFPDNISTQSVNGDICDLSEECDTASMNILYRKGDAYLTESPINSDNVPVPDSAWSRTAICYQQMQNHFQKSSSHVGTVSMSKAHAKSKPKTNEEKTAPIRKDTRQNLVEQTREQLRRQILDEISRTFHEKPDPRLIPEQRTWIKQFQTIGVSTESTPRLLPESPKSANQSKDTNVADLTPEPQTFLVMNAETTNVNSPSILDVVQKKEDVSCIDLRLQQIMGTVLESGTETQSQLADDQLVRKYLHNKISAIPLAKLEEILSTIYSDDKSKNQVSSPRELVNSSPTPPNEYSFIPNCYSAYYNPPPMAQSPLTPNPQFELISLCLKLSSDICPNIVDAGSLNIPRSPVTCPISSCQRAFFVSDFTNHIAVDHTKVPIERILPHQCKNFFLDPKLIHFGISRCQVLLLIKDRIRNLGHEKFKDFIPVLVMTTKVSLLELCSSKYNSDSDEVKRSTQNFFMIWFTGIMPPQLPIFYSLTVWARSGYRPTCHYVCSGLLYSIRNSQAPDAVRGSGQMMLLSEAQVDLLTNRGRYMLELQIRLH